MTSLDWARRYPFHILSGLVGLGLGYILGNPQFGATIGLLFSFTVGWFSRDIEDMLNKDKGSE